MQTIRPGILVSLKTTLTGNISYSKREIEADHVTEDGALAARWETERVIDEPGEYERAVKARGKASNIIRGACIKSAFGLLCPVSDAEALEAAIRDARYVVDAFNSSAKQTRINVFALCGRVSENDAEAIRSINSEIRDLMAAMENGIANLDASAIRDAANRVRGVGQMLPADARSKVKDAIDAARSVARRIVKAGESAAIQVDQEAIRRITEGRLAFLDLNDTGDVAAPAEAGRSIDLEPEKPVADVLAEIEDATGKPGLTIDESPAIEAAPYVPPQFALEL